jgi:hypothetical protein
MTDKAELCPEEPSLADQSELRRWRRVPLVLRRIMVLCPCMMTIMSLPWPRVLSPLGVATVWKYAIVAALWPIGAIVVSRIIR